MKKFESQMKEQDFLPNGYLSYFLTSGVLKPLKM